MPTQKYLIIQRSVPEKREPPSPAQMQEMYAAFNGPFVEAKEIVGGYMVVVAESYDRALDVARECPGVLMPGSSIEIREMAGP